MRWKAYQFLNSTESTTKETYAFKSWNSSPRINVLIPFEDGMLNLLQNSLKTQIENSKMGSRIPADKTTNYYTMTPASYDKFIKEHVMKTYKKSSDSVANKLDTQSASIAKQLKLDDRMRS